MAEMGKFLFLLCVLGLVGRACDIWFPEKLGDLTLGQKIEKSLTCDLANRKTFDFLFY